MNKPLVQAHSLGKTYQVKSGFLRPRRKLEAVSGVDFAVEEGSTFGLVRFWTTDRLPNFAASSSR